jgi:hypothetical protein
MELETVLARTLDELVVDRSVGSEHLVQQRLLSLGRVESNLIRLFGVSPEELVSGGEDCGWIGLDDTSMTLFSWNHDFALIPLERADDALS